MGHNIFTLKGMITIEERSSRVTREYTGKGFVINDSLEKTILSMHVEGEDRPRRIEFYGNLGFEYNNQIISYHEQSERKGCAGVITSIYQHITPITTDLPEVEASYRERSRTVSSTLTRECENCKE